jgi:hypothetical protein
VQLVASPRNLGFAGGMNLGIEWALAQGAEWILALNNDTELAPDMIPGLLEAAGRLPAAGILGPAIYYHDRPQKVWRLGDREMRWLPATRQVSPRQADGASPVRVDYVTGCAMLIRRAVFDAIGLLDARYFMYFEDADYCRRARAAGFEVWAVPAAKMWHRVASSARRARPLVRYTESWGRARFQRTSAQRSRRALSTPYLLLRAARTTLGDAAAGDWPLLRPLWQGLLDGLRDRPLRWPGLP